MHLESISIRNFRCFANTPEVIPLEKELTVFVGSNGSGKTTILNAMQRLFGKTGGERRLSRSDVHFGPNEIAGVEPDIREAGDVADYVSTRQIQIEVILAFPELQDDQLDEDIVPDVFNAMSVAGLGQPLKARIRLEATWSWGRDEDDIEQSLYWITSLDDVPFGDDDIAKIPLRANDRKRMQIRYLPATRDSAAITRSALKELLTWLERFGDWSDGQSSMAQHSDDLQNLFDGMPAIREVTQQLTVNWQRLFDGPHLKKVKFSVLSREIQKALKDLSIALKVGPDGRAYSIFDLSEGQSSLFYIALVFTLLKLDGDLARGGKNGFQQVEELRPWFTLLILEEPENHLSPFYLSRMIGLMLDFVGQPNGQGILTTHSPATMRRIKPEQIRYVRHSSQSLESYVSSIRMPPEGEAAHKFVYEAVRSHPELYFSKLVILGEGRSEEIVLPKLASAWSKDLELDPAFIAFVPLGGRHVNHFWKLLEALKIPYVTLLDYDLGRYRAGPYRVKYVVDQLYALGITRDGFEKPRNVNDVYSQQEPNLFLGWWNFIREQDVFYSTLLDLDMMLIQAFEPQYLQIADLPAIDDVATYTASVFGKAGAGLTEWEQSSWPTAQQLAIYEALFSRGSKPVSHIEALKLIPNEDLKKQCPLVLRDLFNCCVQKLGA